MIGVLNRLVTLSRPVRVEDEGGGAPVTFTVVASVWAEVVAAGGGEAVIADAVRGTLTHRIRIRHRADVSAGWRASWSGRTARVLAARDPTGRGRWLNLECEEEVP